MNLRPIYLHSPVSRPESLALALGVELDLLRSVAKRANGLYSSFPKEKPDGTLRTISSPQEPLRSIQKAIYRKILRFVVYPDYLHGAIKRRSRVTNAQAHLRQHVLVSLDISKFYDNAREELVFDVWRRLLRFSDPVAELLTALTTRNGVLPQGASTSQALANLLFWEREWRLVRTLQSEGLRYTRFVDDTYVSAGRHLQQAELQRVIGSVRALFASYGLHAKNKKTSVTFGGTPQTVNHLLTNRRIAMRGSDRRKVRAAVYRFCLSATAEEVGGIVDSPERLKGRLGNLAQFHPSQAQRLRQQLVCAGGIRLTFAKGKGGQPGALARIANPSRQADSFAAFAHSADRPQFPVDQGFESGLGAPCRLFKCMRESSEWGPP